MQSSIKQQDINFIFCPACNGLGKNERGAECPNCGGMGLGVFFMGRFYYWGRELSLAAIKLNRLKIIFNLAINAAAYFAGLAGLAAFGWWIWLASDSKILDAFYFWQIKSPLLLIFWPGVLAGMFIFYRFSE